MSKKFEQTVLGEFAKVHSEIAEVKVKLQRLDEIEDTLNLFRKDLNETKNYLEEKIDDTQQSLEVKIDTVKGSLENKIDTLRNEMDLSFDEAYNTIKAVGVKVFDNLQPRIKALEDARA